MVRADDRNIVYGVLDKTRYHDLGLDELEFLAQLQAWTPLAHPAQSRLPLLLPWVFHRVLSLVSIFFHVLRYS